MSNKYGYLGPSGTFSEEAAINYCRDNTEITPYNSISGIIKDIKNRRLEGGIIPIENSLEGSINLTMDLLLEESFLEIADEVILSIRQYLLASPGVEMDSIVELFSHFQAIRQSREFIDKFLGEVKISFTDSTAQAVKMVKGEHGKAMIGSGRINQLYGLEILAEDIQDNFNNYTRFIVVKERNKKDLCGSLLNDFAYKTSIICTPRVNEAGVLYKILGEFAKLHINLTRIESRPTKKRLGEYLFYIDLDGHKDEERILEALKRVKKRSGLFKILGSYKKAEIRRGSSEYVRREA